MISSASSAPIADAIGEGNSPGVTASTPSKTKAAFDSILALENLAATCNALSPTALEGVVEGLSEAPAEDDELDNDDGEDGELGALEFLAALLNTPMPFKPAMAGPQQGGGEASESTEEVSSAVARAAVEPASLLADASDPAATSQASSEKLLALAGQSATAVEGLAASRDGMPDPAAQVARSAELFTQASRQAEVERPGIATSVRDPRWSEEFSTRVAMMVRGNESQASLQLSPVELGPMDVSVTVRDSQATIHFGAAQAETRALIEASIPRLREMLAAQGFNLMDASVSQGFSRQSQPGAATAGAGGSTESEPDSTVARVAPAGLLDLYA